MKDSEELGPEIAATIVDAVPSFDCKFVFQRLLPAALMDATLICLCMFVIWYAVFLAVGPVWFLVYSNNSIMPFHYLAFVLAVFAPIVYSAIWKLLKFERSPGKQWMGLDWPVEVRDKPWITLIDVSASLTACFASVAVVSFYCGVFKDSLNGSLGLIYVAVGTIVPLLYFWALIILLLLNYLNAAKMPQLSGSIWLPKLASSARIWPALKMFCMPYIFAVCIYVLNPWYYWNLQYQSAAWLVLLIVSLWWAAGAVIIRYGNFRNSYIFYTAFFVLPGLGYLQILPALSGLISVHGPSSAHLK